MQNPLSFELGRKYVKSYALYRKSGDETPIWSASFSGDDRIPVRRLLIAAAVAAGVALFAAVAAELDRFDAKKK